MALQFSGAVRSARLEAIETIALGQTFNASTVGGSASAPTLEIRTGAAPATTATADSGTVLATITLPITTGQPWADAAGGSKALSGTWQATAAAAGTAGHFRIKNGATTHVQGSCGSAIPLTTNALTAANSNVLNFAATTGVAVGQMISGTGIPAGAQVLAFTGTTVTMSIASTAGVANGASITFSGDMTLDNTSIGVGQQVTVTAFTLVDGNA